MARGGQVIRSEYVDHVAALCAASLISEVLGEAKASTIADVTTVAVAVATALADLRYPAERTVEKYEGPDAAAELSRRAARTGVLP